MNQEHPHRILEADEYFLQKATSELEGDPEQLFFIAISNLYKESKDTVQFSASEKHALDTLLLSASLNPQLYYQLVVQYSHRFHDSVASYDMIADKLYRWFQGIYQDFESAFRTFVLFCEGTPYLDEDTVDIQFNDQIVLFGLQTVVQELEESDGNVADLAQSAQIVLRSELTPQQRIETLQTYILAEIFLTEATEPTELLKIIQRVIPSEDPIFQNPEHTLQFLDQLLTTLFEIVPEIEELGALLAEYF